MKKREREMTEIPSLRFENYVKLKLLKNLPIFLYLDRIICKK